MPFLYATVLSEMYPHSSAVYMDRLHVPDQWRIFLYYTWKSSEIDFSLVVKL